ncbi:MAG TPA: hypothetical protein PKM56_15360, partial [Candidatus Rifleibacterium sp.]|nr:hypothetical protein [Candidatus Rifleibacterium sp.]
VVVSDRRENGAVERTLTLPVAPTRVNQAPIIGGIEISSTPVYGYTDYTLTVTASDPDNDPIYYQWVGSGTILEPTKATTPWKTPVVLAIENREVSVMVSDIKGASAFYTATFAINPTSIRPPEVTILTPHLNELLLTGKPVAFNGQAIATGNVEINEARFTWYEKLEGGQYSALKTGLKAFNKAYNTPGTYTVKLEAFDSLYVVGENTVTFRINATPTVTITAPADKAIAQLGSTVSFSATGADTEDVTISDSRYYWSFPTPVGSKTGANQSTNALPAGTQTAEVYVADNLTATSTTATRKIFINPPPTITDIQPASGSVYMQGDNVAFSTTVVDTEGVLVAGNINWYVGTPLTAIGSGLSFTKNNLAGGWNTITLKASDTMGGQTATTTMVFINTAPTMQIDLPLDRSSIGLNQTFKFKGSGTDTAGTIDTMLFTWEDYGVKRGATSSIAIPLGGTPAEFDFIGYTNTADFGSHTITLYGTDQQGAIGKKSVEIFVNSLPMVSITDPASGTRHDTATNLTFNATLKEDDPTDILSVRWYDAATNTTPLYTQTGLTVDETTKERTVSFTTSALASGVHNIFCQVTDMHGKTAVASTGVMINRLPILTSGKIKINTVNYATAPSDIPVFLSTSPSMSISFTVDDFDYELSLIDGGAGSINNWKSSNIKWESNKGVFGETSTGNTISQLFPIGYNEVTVRLFDTFYASPTTNLQINDQASSSYKIAFYVWQSKSLTIPSTVQNFSGLGKAFYMVNNDGTPEILYYDYTGGDIVNPYILQDAEKTCDLVATTSFAIGYDCTVYKGDVVALGSNTATVQKFAWFEDVASPTAYNVPGGLIARSLTCNQIDDSVGYMIVNNSVVPFNPVNWALDGSAITTAQGQTFLNPTRVRYADVAPAYTTRVLVADTGRDRVVRFLNDLSEPRIVYASSPVDMAATPKRMLTVSSANSNISVHDISTTDSTVLMTFGGTTTTAEAGKFQNPVAMHFVDKDLLILELGNLGTGANRRLQLIRSGETDWLK